MKRILCISWVLCFLLSSIINVALVDSSFQTFLSPRTCVSPQKPPEDFLADVKRNLRRAAEVGDFRDVILTGPNGVLECEDVVTVSVPVLMDDGSTQQFTGWRVTHNTLLGPGKGGIRVAAGLKLEQVKALATDMSIKNAVAGLDLGGAKGGINTGDVDPRKLSRAEFARMMRSYVKAVLNEVWKKSNHTKIAFNVYTDVPAPDVGTSPVNGLNLMNLCVDQLLRWCARHSEDYAKWVNQEVAKEKNTEAQDKKRLYLTLPPELIEMAREGQVSSSEVTPYLDKYIEVQLERMRKTFGKKRTLALVGAFTGKEAGTKKGEMDVGKGGSKGRGEATGLGVAYAALEALKRYGLPDEVNEKSFKGQSVAVQGFGNVGSGAVSAFTKLGAKVVAIAEYDPKTKKLYAIHKQAGFSGEEVEALKKCWNTTRTLIGFPNSTTIEISAFWRLNVDILAPCAAEKQIDGNVAPLIRARLIVEGANGPTTPEGDKVLFGKGIKVVPDVLANSGGVYVSYLEMVQNILGVSWSEEEVYARLYATMKKNFTRLADISAGERGKLKAPCTLREAAYVLALRKLEKQMAKNGLIVDRPESLDLTSASEISPAIEAAI